MIIPKLDLSKIKRDVDLTEQTEQDEEAEDADDFEDGPSVIEPASDDNRDCIIVDEIHVQDYSEGSDDLR